MELSKEQVDRINACQSPEELVEVATELGYELTVDEAKVYFQDEVGTEELSATELDNVEGGSQCKSGKTYSSDPPYKLIVSLFNSCPSFRSMGGRAICANCFYRSDKGIATYCDLRTRYNDPYR